MKNFREELMKVLQASLGDNFEVSVAEAVKNNETKLEGNYLGIKYAHVKILSESLIEMQNYRNILNFGNATECAWKF